MKNYLSDDLLLKVNASVINSEIEWLKNIIDCRLAPNGDTCEPFYKSMNPIEELNDCYYTRLIKQHGLSDPDRLLLLCAFIPHIAPGFFAEYLRVGEIHNEATLGGYRVNGFNTVAPTLQTLLFLAAGTEVETCSYYEAYYTQQSVLIKEQVAILSKTNHENVNSRQKVVELSPEHAAYLIYGKQPRPDFGKNFPATLISTSLDWENLVVHDGVRKELNRIGRWSSRGLQLIEKTGGRIGGSFPCLFYGPPGTGKTLAAQLLGKQLGVDVFKIDLSMVVSKYIGETEKNLSFLFDRAKNKNWILFFDEADSLFGKRTNISDAKDKWANLEMSYLLQRMEEHNGLTILATNYKSNLDEAMARRFQAQIYFGRPDKEQREKLWRSLMPEPYSYPEDINHKALAEYELTGAHIMNAIKAACLEAEYKNTEVVSADDLLDAINREFYKEGKRPPVN